MYVSLLFKQACATTQYLVNGGSEDIETGWTFSIGNPDYVSVFQTWNWNAEGAMDSSGTAHGYADQVCIAFASYALGVVIPGVSIWLTVKLMREPAGFGDHAGAWQEHCH